MYNGTQIFFRNGKDVKDANIITDHFLSTLAPYEMYRWAMLNQSNVKFLDSSYIPVEEDRVFNMTTYSVSRKISILVDKDYCYWNQQEDFGNLARVQVITIMNLNNISTSYQKYSILLRCLLIEFWHSSLNLRQMYIGRLFNGSYTTVIEIIKLQKNEKERR